MASNFNDGNVFLKILCRHEIFEEKILGAGYYPLPNFFSKVDPRHSAFLTIKIRK